MTPERAKYLLPFITAFAEGTPVEGKVVGDWKLVTGDARWPDAAIYRIAPASPGQVLFELFYSPTSRESWAKWEDANQDHWNDKATKFLEAMKARS